MQLIDVNEKDGCYTLSVTTKRSTKYWCWKYADLQTAETVRHKLYERWDDCPVQKFEDYMQSFVANEQDVALTQRTAADMNESWLNKPADKINLKQVSG